VVSGLETVGYNMLLSVLFAILGFVLLFIGFKVFDWLTPTDLASQVFENGNLAAAILSGAFIIGLALIVSAAIG
jgi:uncharacterized membrane protein YjfL (UPF0719 family)